MTSHVDHAVKWLSRVLLATGVACLAWCGAVWMQTTAYQHEQRLAFDQVVREITTSSAARVAAPLGPGAPIGFVEIPHVRVSAVVIEGDGDSALKVAIGHLPDTPLPWEGGNSALAGHRDTFFRALKTVTAGDLIRLVTSHGEFDYQVRDTLIVSPDDVWVLNPTTHPSITLITCYPFSYIGRAPRRFVVRAEQTRQAWTDVGLAGLARPGLAAWRPEP